MEARTLGLKRLRRIGALGVAGAATLLLVGQGVDRWSIAWLIGALVGAELAAQAGCSIAGKNPLHALWLAPLSALIASAIGTVGMMFGGAGLAGLVFGLVSAPVALIWGTLLGLLSAVVEGSE